MHVIRRSRRDELPDVELTIDRYTQLVRKVEFEDLDLGGAFQAQRLDEDVLRCLRYMHDVEMHTVCYLRDLLVTSAHRDPEITAFLTFWSFEEYWHGAALAQVLAAHGEVAGPSRVRQLRASRRLTEALKPTMHAAGSALVGRAMTAVHMAWGAVNEWTTQAGYARLAQRSQHPVLSELLRRIMRQEGRHIDFYASQARRRLEESAAARTITRAALARLWKPVGSDVMPPAEVQHLVSFLFGGAEGASMAARIDRRIDLLPGLADLGLVSGAAARRLAA